MPDEDAMPEIARTIQGISAAVKPFLLLDNFRWGGAVPSLNFEILSGHGGEKLHIVGDPPLFEERGGLIRWAAFLSLAGGGVAAFPGGYGRLLPPGGRASTHGRPAKKSCA